MLTESEKSVEIAKAPRLLNEHAVVLSGVSVRYRIPIDPMNSLKEQVIRRLQGRHMGSRELWALRDLNLEVRRGEALGIIGRNGAGKSTLLKVIARVVRPTSGSVRVWGSVAPLLSLGGGFHPELTGRENIFLKGALLGFSRANIQQKVDSIIEFAELSEFIDAPLRTYSSGMMTRLGFAIATDVEPDILIIDEVLAVGDESFRQKSLVRMQYFLEQDTTILFVSHAVEVIREICSSAIWVDQGQISASGAVDEVMESYHAHSASDSLTWGSE